MSAEGTRGRVEDVYMWAAAAVPLSAVDEDLVFGAFRDGIGDFALHRVLLLLSYALYV
jgi:hypothetical protein